jgi:hypothetical protein
MQDTKKQALYQKCLKNDNFLLFLQNTDIYLKHM